MKKVLIIHTGGTFGMTPADPGKILQPGKIEESLGEFVPSIHQIAEISIKIPFNLDSSNIGTDEWKILYDIIRMAMEDSDGVVIIHGTDTLVYTAAALSYLFLDLKKPIVLTGSQRPLSALRSDARSNLINAVELATYAIPEVLVCFGNKVYRGNRSKKISIERFESFDSPNYPPLATIGLNVHVNAHYILQSKANVQLKSSFFKGILALRVFPGLDPKKFMPLLDNSLKAIILEGFGAGNLPGMTMDWVDFISVAVLKQKLVFIGSQSSHGTIDLQLYSCGQQAEQAGALSLGDMTIEAALVKLMILLANFEDLEKVKKYMMVSLAGEIT